MGEYNGGSLNLFNHISNTEGFTRTGGLSEREIEQAIALDFQALALGPRVLRTETAPLAAISILQSLWGDMG